MDRNVPVRQVHVELNPMTCGMVKALVAFGESEFMNETNIFANVELSAADICDGSNAWMTEEGTTERQAHVIPKNDWGEINRICGV